MHQVASKITKFALSLTLAFGLVPIIPTLAFAEPEVVAVSPEQTTTEPSTSTGEQLEGALSAQTESSAAEETPAEGEASIEGKNPADESIPEEVVAPEVDTAANAAAADKQEAPVAEQRSVGFVYFDESAPSVGGQQLVAVAIDDDAFVVASAELTYITPSGEKLTAAASENAESAALFPVDVQEVGEYQLKSMTAVGADGLSVEVDLSAKEDVSYSFTASEAVIAAFSLDEEVEDGDVSVFTLTDDGQLEEAASLDEAVQLSAEAAPAAASRSALSTSRAASGKFVIALDPGHGGTEPGASGFGLTERDLTWKITQYCKEALGTYANVEVVLTRSQNETVGLSERVRRAVAAKANVFVSLHINSSTAAGPKGAEVWYPNDSSYKYELHEEGKELATKIQEKLVALGLADRGIKVRDSSKENGEGPYYYPDNSIQDYYTVIEKSREAGIVGIIVEHAFVSNLGDNSKLKKDSFLRDLGYADAAGIAEAYGLSDAWELIDGRWKLKLADDSYATNTWMQLKGKWYWFGADSFAVTGWQTIGGAKYYFDSSCAMRSNGWLQLGSDWFWLSGSGVMQTGWVSTGKAWYWLDPTSGKMATGWTKATDGKWYYLNSSGAMQSNGWLKQGSDWYWLSGSGVRATGWISTGGAWYWLEPTSGKMATGWTKATDGKWYYLNSSGAMQSNGWLKLGSTWYWLTGSGAMQTGWLKTGGKWYWLTDSGAMATGWAKAKDDKWYYLDGSGAMQSNGWLKLGSSWYWLTSSGAMQTGWLSTGGKWYWLTDSGAMATGWAKAKDDKWYYLEGSGAMRSGGWSKIGGAWYWLTSSGAMQTGWLSTGGKWYWLTDSGAMATGWAKAKDDKWYYLNGSGAMQSGGWFKLGSSWYYLNGSGAMQTGWLDLGSKRYYLNESGAMVTGAVTIDGQTYQFDKSGSLQSSASIMGTSLTTVAQMVSYYNTTAQKYGFSYPVDKYTSKGAPTVGDFCQILLNQANSEGVRAEVLFVQAMLETGWLQFGGDVDRNGKVQCNFGGLGATGNGAPGETFPDVKTGLLAQTQHLKGYASTEDLNQACVDTRFKYLSSKRGSAPTVDKLAGTWATDTTYGTKLTKSLGELLAY